MKSYGFVNEKLWVVNEKLWVRLGCLPRLFTNKLNPQLHPFNRKDEARCMGYVWVCCEYSIYTRAFHVSRVGYGMYVM